MADSIIPSDLKARFPEFNDELDTRIQALIDDTACNFNIARWDCAYTRAHCLYVAHALTLDNRRLGVGGSAPVLQATSKSADGVSISYNANATSNNTDEYFKSTSYGQEYLVMLENVKTPGAKVILP